MAWPADDLSVTNYDQGTDDPSLARSQLIDLKTKVSALIAGRATPNGVCDLDSGGKVPTARFPAAYAKDAANGIPSLNASSDLSLRGFDITYNETRVALGGDFSAGAEVVMVRVGSLVVASWDALPHSSSGTPVSTTGIVPAAFRPTNSNGCRNVIRALTRLQEITITAAGTVIGQHSNDSLSSVSSTSITAGMVAYAIHSEVP